MTAALKARFNNRLVYPQARDITRLRVYESRCQRCSPPVCIAISLGRCPRLQLTYALGVPSLDRTEKRPRWFSRHFSDFGNVSTCTST
jgi:hypothetical protein